MDTKIIVHGTIHGSYETQQEIKSKDLAEYIGNKTDDLDIYYFHPKPGMAAGFDWQIILSTTADIIAVGGVLWAAYEKFIKPRLTKEKDKNSSEAFYILIGYPEGPIAEFHLGKDIIDREKFIELFAKAVSEAQRSPQHQKIVKTIIKELDKSEVWIPVKRKKKN